MKVRAPHCMSKTQNWEGQVLGCSWCFLKLRLFFEKNQDETHRGFAL